MDSLTDRSIAIRFEHVSLSLESKGETLQVLHDIHGDIPQGMKVTVIGPSGSGKSTLLSLCNLMQTPNQGHIFVSGTEVRQWNIPELRRYTGMVFQTPTMLPGTVYDNLVIGAKIAGKTIGNPEGYLEQVGLPRELLNRNAQDLSGGQKQRVALARTLVTEPQILLLDEVTSALDPTSAREVEELIVHLNRARQITMIWVTHQLEQAKRVGDLTWVLVNGRLVETGMTSALFENPSTDTTRLFLSGKLTGGDIQ